MRQELLIIVQDIISLNLSGYDIVALQWYPWFFRIRKGKIRVIFTKQDNKGTIQKIDFRGDVYKGL